MAGLPPGMQAGPPPGGMPMGQPGGLPPMPPPGLMPGMPPMGAPPFAPQMTPPPQPQPTESIYTDISQKLPKHYQILDAASRIIQRALDSGGFYQEPAVLGSVLAIKEDLDKIIDAYARKDSPKGKGGDNTRTLVDTGNVETVDLSNSEE